MINIVVSILSVEAIIIKNPFTADMLCLNRTGLEIQDQQTQEI